MYQPQPKVVTTLPLGYSDDVDTRTDIQLSFNVDLDRNHIADSIFVTDDLGQNIDVQVSYSNRVITLHPVPSLEPNRRYSVRIVGGLNGQSNPAGIRDILNNPLAKDFVLAFNTVKVVIMAAPIPLYPLTQSIIQEQPQFSWEPVEGAVSYQIKVSPSNSLVPVVWPADSDIAEFPSSGPIVPGYQFPDGTYYWMIRAVAADGSHGEWSSVFSFSKDTLIQATQASGDTVAPDAVPYYESTLLDPLEILEIFPLDEQSNVDIRLKVIYIRINGHYTGDQIRAEDITLFGQNVDGMSSNPDYPDHGNVSYSLEVQPQNDGTTILKLTLDSVPFVSYISTQF